MTQAVSLTSITEWRTAERQHPQLASDIMMQLLRNPVIANCHQYSVAATLGFRTHLFKTKTQVSRTASNLIPWDCSVWNQVAFLLFWRNFVPTDRFHLSSCMAERRNCIGPHIMSAEKFNTVAPVGYPIHFFDSAYSGLVFLCNVRPHNNGFELTSAAGRYYVPTLPLTWTKETRRVRRSSVSQHTLTRRSTPLIIRTSGATDRLSQIVFAPFFHSFRPPHFIDIVFVPVDLCECNCCTNCIMYWNSVNGRLASISLFVVNDWQVARRFGLQDMVLWRLFELLINWNTILLSARFVPVFELCRQICNTESHNKINLLECYAMQRRKSRAGEIKNLQLVYRLLSYITQVVKG